MRDFNVFRVGDYVEYVVDHMKKPNGVSWKGSTGIVLDPSCLGWSSHEVCQVKWLTGDLVDYTANGNPNVKNYTSCIRLIEVPYDPNQAGDTDEDI